MDDLEYCVRALEAVSRTFSKPIALLPEGPLRTTVVTSYLLCRIADTVEDHPGLLRSTRLALFEALLDVLEHGGSTESFVASMNGIEGEESDVELARSLPRVMRVFSPLPESSREAVTPWIAEMVRGMAVYACRRPGTDGLVAVETLADLERYCWFVAGTVGRMLTELFCQHLGDTLSEDQRHALASNAEEFALGLQLTNILKDVTDDRTRRVSYVPRSCCRAEGVPLSELVLPEHRAASHRVLAPLFARASRALDAAFVYSLAIPASAPGIRSFCVLPVFMAVRTLQLAEGNDDVFIEGSPVKISRAEVESILDLCAAHVSDDVALTGRFQELREGMPAGQTVQRSPSAT